MITKTQQQTTPYDTPIQKLQACGRQGLTAEQYIACRAQVVALKNKREGYLAAVADHADLLAVATDASAYFEEFGYSLPQSQTPGKLFSQRTPLAIRDRLRAALAKHSPQAKAVTP